MLYICICILVPGIRGELQRGGLTPAFAPSMPANGRCIRIVHKSSLYTRQYSQEVYIINTSSSNEENKTLKSDATNQRTRCVTRHTMTTSSRASSSARIAR